MITKRCAHLAQNGTRRASLVADAPHKRGVKVLIDDEFAGIDLAAYEKLFFDEPFNIALGEALQMGRQLLKVERGAERIIRHVGYEPRRGPDTDAAKAFGTSRASFVEELDYDLRTHEGIWKTTPNMMPDRVRNTGTIAVTAVPAGVRRTVRSEVTVKLLGFGGLIERAITAEIVKSYGKTTDFTRAWIAKLPR